MSSRRRKHHSRRLLTAFMFARMGLLERSYRLACARSWCLAVGLAPLLAIACSGSEEDPGQTSASTQPVALPISERVTIDLSAGMPGQSHWRYLKGQDSTTFATPSF